MGHWRKSLLGKHRDLSSDLKQVLLACLHLVASKRSGKTGAGDRGEAEQTPLLSVEVVGQAIYLNQPSSSFVTRLCVKT